ncbi:MAG: glycosyltransferase family 2 protein [Planctomycetales bacterium]|nr:glycosyltransferase family 2 protein [Planctomycetales bacterium]
METLALGLMIVLGLLLAGQFPIAFYYISVLRRRPPQLLEGAELPKAAVVLCLRGSDPFLERSLAGLLNQDYGDYEVHVVVDHPEDPAVEVLNACLDRHRADPGTREGQPEIHVEFLRNPSPHCSLKCSSLAQAIESLDDSIEIVAQLDADTEPHASWLRELATAFQDKQVAVATGNRWYLPDNPTMANLVRRAWNAAAIILMFLKQIPWGGSLAIRASVLRDSDLLDRWRHALCEDTMLLGHAKRLGMKVAFVPSLMMPNREDCEFRGYYRWVKRQLLVARLYHSGWWLVLLHGFSTGLLWLASLAVAIVAWIAGEQRAAAIGLLTAIGYPSVLIGLQAILAAAIHGVLRAKGEPIRRRSWRDCLMTPIAVFVTQFVYIGALFQSCFLREVEWRGIHYDILAPFQIQMREYHPYRGGNEGNSL